MAGFDFAKILTEETTKTLECGDLVQFPLDLNVDDYEQDGMNNVLTALTFRPDVFTQIWYSNKNGSKIEGMKLAQVVRKSHVLQVLLITGTFSREVALELASALRENYSLSYLNVDESFPLFEQEIFNTFKNTGHLHDPQTTWIMSKDPMKNVYCFKRLPRLP